MEVKAKYEGEMGQSGYYRTTKGHKADIKGNKIDKSARAKHFGGQQLHLQSGGQQHDQEQPPPPGPRGPVHP